MSVGNNQLEARNAKRSIKRQPRALRVEAIEDAARVVFCRRGYAAASIAEIAAEAGLSEGSIYKFFESKRHLVLRVIEGWYESMIREFEVGLAGISGTSNKMRFIIWRHLHSLKRDPELARLCVNEVRNGGDYYQSDLLALNRRYTRIFIDVCKEGVAKGELRSDIPVTLMRDLVFGCIDHHISGMLYGRDDIDVDASTEKIMRTVFVGIQGKSTRPSSHDQSVDDKLDQITQRLDEVVGLLGRSQV
ncbi:MAG TPA: hypothetical protein DEB15_16975 [Pusillimonas sp.]|jgi:AcrR family transcriptional regulator|nr:hypothetical protein [Pusillimonas sp.]|tara:strand:+ start:128794 stop:129534 length:741 start_codon:yes stop_codon:yes gene_type:complete